MPDPDTAVSLVIEGPNGELRTFSTDAEERQNKLKLRKGLNKHVWNLRRDNLKSIPGLMTFGGTNGTRVGPSDYKVTVKWGEDSESAHDFAISTHPDLSVDQSAHDEKQQLLSTLYDATQEVFDEVKNMRHMRDQIKAFQERDGVSEDTVLYNKGKHIIATLDSLEKTIVQAQQKTFTGRDQFSEPDRWTAHAYPGYHRRIISTDYAGPETKSGRCT